MTDTDDELKDHDDPEKEAEGEHEETEPNLAEVIGEPEVEEEHFPIGAPVATFDESLDEVEDRHDAVFGGGKTEDSRHLDLYGIGAPEGFDGEPGEFEDDEEDPEFLDNTGY